MAGVYDYDGPPRVAHEGHLYYKDVIRDGADYDLDPVAPEDRLRVVVSGGSMGGLFTAIALREVGHDVEVFERTTGGLEQRGAGIIAHPPMFDFFEERDVVDREEIGTSTDRVEWLGRDGSVLRAEEMEIWMTSWGTVYRNLRAQLDDDRYHLGREVTGVERDADGATAHFADGDAESGDLVVAAEGYRSSTRRQLLPGSDPEYAGYVAFRGTVREGELDPAALERFGEVYTLFHGPDLQFLAYPVPGPNDEVEKGERDVNWVWYYPVPEDDLDELLLDAEGRQREYSLPPGAMRDEVRDRQVGIARERLPEVLSELVAETVDPFIQNIYDLSVPRMVFDRVCLLGDGAFFARPHTGSGTAKAADDGFRLAEELDGEGDVDAALEGWQETQLDLGERLVDLGRDRGDRYTGQF